MHLETTIEVGVAPAKVWAIWTAIDRWPEWNEAVEKIEWSVGTTFEEGNRLRISQPGLPTNDWLLTDVEPGRYFAWRVVNFGVKTVAGHDVAPLEDGGSLVTLTLDQTGFFAPVVERTLGKKTRGFVDLEAQGLKDRVARNR